MAYNKHDPLETFSNDVGTIAFSRTPAAPGTGVDSPRQQINTISSSRSASTSRTGAASRFASTTPATTRSA
jgi:hypothetical protein